MNVAQSLAAIALTLCPLNVSAQEVNIYSHRQPELIKPLIDAFTEETGITVNIAFVGKGITERLIAEGRRSPADLVLTVDISRLSDIADAGVTQPVDVPQLRANIPATLRDPDGHWFGLTSRARIIYASKTRVAPEDITTYEDLTDEKWRGRLCVRSGLNDYNVALVAAMIAHHGEAETKNWLRGIKANLARRPQGGDRDQVKAIAAGECDIAIGNTYYIGQMLSDPAQRAEAETVNVVFPTFEGDGAHINISGMALTKAAPNKAEALELMAWLSTDEAQAIYAETNHEFPVKEGAKRSALVQSWGEFTPDSTPLATIAYLRPAAVRLIEEVDFDG